MYIQRSETDHPYDEYRGGNNNGCQCNDQRFNNRSPTDNIENLA
ncbi:hypothetical protein [Lapillicoccus sp.]|nr:hypothetical protein [Lapillicoccus sp.]